MEKAVDYRSLSRLVMAQIRPGVVTNNFMDKSDYLSEIESGTLYYHAYEGGLLLFRRRRGFSLMNYYLTDPEILPKLTEGEILLTEPVLRPEDDGETVLRFLKDLGFETLFHRERFVRQEEMSSGRQEEAAGAEERENVTAARNDMSGYRSGIAELPGFGDDFSEAGGEAAGGRIRVCRAEPGDDQGVYDLLTSCFDPQTACLPQRQEIKGIIAEGRIICAKGVSEDIEGVLHFKHGKKSSEIRHLATAEGMRGQGLAQGMLHLYLGITERKTALVWARRDNKPAVEFYRESGYRPDGWTSAVLRRKERK